jgi:hypothetical protein
MNIADSEVPSGHDSPGRCAEHLSRIADLEGRLSLLKRQAKTAMDQDGKSFSLLKRVSSLESQMSVLMAKIIQLKEYDAFITEIIESACEQLQCKLFGAPECLLLLLLVRYILTSCFLGICLDPVGENRRVSERVVALERVSSDTNTFWVDARRCGAIVLLQDRVRHVGESVDGCRKSLTTIFPLCFLDSSS